MSGQYRPVEDRVLQEVPVLTMKELVALYKSRARGFPVRIPRVFKCAGETYTCTSAGLIKAGKRIIL